MKEITIYQTGDSKRFDKKSDAEAWEIVIELAKIIAIDRGAENDWLDYIEYVLPLIETKTRLHYLVSKLQDINYGKDLQYLGTKS